MPADERVNRSSFSDRIQPISAPRPMPLLPRRIWSDDDWQRIQLGYYSRDMDEKWDVFAEGDVVFLHRSWTGRGIFEANFAPADGGGWQIAEALVERDPERFRGDDDEHDCLMLELVLSTVVLGEPAQELRSKFVELTRKRSGNADVPAGLVQHSALGLHSDFVSRRPPVSRAGACPGQPRREGGPVDECFGFGPSGRRARPHWART